MRAALLIACWAAFSVPVALVVAAGFRSARGVELAEELERYLWRLTGLSARYDGSGVTDRLYAVGSSTSEILGVEPSDDDVGECSADWRELHGDSGL